MGEREGEKHQCAVASYVASTGDLARNPGMCPDWESNWQPFGLQPELNPLSYTSQGWDDLSYPPQQGPVSLHFRWLTQSLVICKALLCVYTGTTVTKIIMNQKYLRKPRNVMLHLDTQEKNLWWGGGKQKMLQWRIYWDQGSRPIRQVSQSLF